MFSIEPVYAIAAIGALYSLASTFVMNKLVDRKKVMEMQEESKQLQKELGEASKSNDMKKIEEVNKKYEKFMPKMFNVQLMQMKPLLVILPALAIFTPWLRSAYSTFVIKLPFSLPIFIQHFEKFPNWRDTYGSVGWFWLCTLGFGLAVYLIKAGYDKLGIKLGLADKLKNAVPKISVPKMFGKKEISGANNVPVAQENKTPENVKNENKNEENKMPPNAEIKK